jgi:hypothetical protein
MKHISRYLTGDQIVKEGSSSFAIGSPAYNPVHASSEKQQLHKRNVGLIDPGTAESAVIRGFSNYVEHL